MVKKDIVIATAVSEDIKKILDNIVERQGTSISEYMRRLIVDELIRLGIITYNIKREADKGGG